LCACHRVQSCHQSRPSLWFSFAWSPALISSRVDFPSALVLCVDLISIDSAARLICLLSLCSSGSIIPVNCPRQRLLWVWFFLCFVCAARLMATAKLPVISASIWWLLGPAWEVLNEMCVRQCEALLVWSVWFNLLFDLAASSVLPFSRAADFSCRSFTCFRFAHIVLCFHFDSTLLT
jgi:hypothetical protein